MASTASRRCSTRRPVGYVVTDSFLADYRRLSEPEQVRFRSVLPAFVEACDRYAADTAAKWPATLGVKDVEGAPGIWEMTWSFSGPDGRATFEWVQIEGTLGLRWRRIGPSRDPQEAMSASRDVDHGALLSRRHVFRCSRVERT